MFPHCFFNFVINLLFPQRCAYCHKEINRSYPLCQNCENRIPVFQLWIPHPTKHLYSLGAATSYQNPIVRQIIHSFKYQGVITLKIPLVRLLIRFVENTNHLSLLDSSNVIIIPIPLSKHKYQQRGFNQAELLAQGIADYFHWNYCCNCLKRIKDNPSQAQLENKKTRRENVKGIFALGPSSQLLQSKMILLVDDVFTTGATMEEAAKILSKAKPQKIIGLVIAK